MRYKVLLTGKNHTMIDDFFSQMGESFEPLTTSRRYEDIASHLNYFDPDIFVYCLNSESNAYINQVISVKGYLEKRNIPFVIIGSEEDCRQFNKCAVDIADLAIIKTSSAISIMNRIVDYMKQQQRLEEEAIRAEEERLAQARAARVQEKGLTRAGADGSHEESPREEEKPSRKHIMVVDDDPMMLKMIKDHLHDRYDVATAPSGKIALKFLEKKKTDLILLDYEMPIDNGPAVLEKIRANSDTQDIPVIFLTGITERGKIQKALSLKPQGYLLKPVDHNKLMTAIINLIG